MQADATGGALPAEPVHARIALRHWVAVVGAVGAEYGLLSVAFEPYKLLAAGGPDSWLGALGTGTTPLLLIVATAAITLGGGRLRAELATVEPSPRPRLIAGGIVHAAIFAALYWATGAVFGSPAGPTPTPAPALVATWGALAFAVPLSALAAAFRLRGMVPLARRLWRPMAWALGVGLLAWGAALAAEGLWAFLSRLTLAVTGRLLTLTSAQAFVDQRTASVGIGNFGVKIAAVCSGYEGIGLISVVIGAYLVAARKRLRFPRALLLLPFSVVLIFSANVLRIASLVLLGAHGFPEIAVGGFHSKAGWILFCSVALGVVAWARRSPFLQKEVERPVEGVSETAAYLLPLLAALATAMVTGLFTTTFDRWYAARIIPALLVLWAYRHAYPAATRPSPLVGPLFGVAAYLLWIAAVPSQPQAGQALRTALGGLGAAERAAWLTARVAGSVLIVPVVEELAFRGYGLRRLVRADFTSLSYRHVTPAAVLISSLAFGVLHQQIVAGTLAGILFALAAQRRGRLADAILAHAIANALIAAHVLLLGGWFLWA